MKNSIRCPRFWYRIGHVHEFISRSHPYVVVSCTFSYRVIIANHMHKCFACNLWACMQKYFRISTYTHQLRTNTSLWFFPLDNFYVKIRFIVDIHLWMREFFLLFHCDRPMRETATTKRKKIGDCNWWDVVISIRRETTFIVDKMNKNLANIWKWSKPCVFDSNDMTGNKRAKDQRG